MVSCKLVDVINSYAEAKLEQPILRVKPKPFPQIQKYVPTHRRKKNKSNEYDIWLDRWAWIPKTAELKVKEPFLKDLPLVLALIDRSDKRR